MYHLLKFIFKISTRCLGIVVFYYQVDIIFFRISDFKNDPSA